MARQKRVGKRPRRPLVTYTDIDREEVAVGNPIDLAVHARVGRGELARKLARLSHAVVDALGKRRKVWFDYEDVLGRLTDLRQAAYFDLGVQHGVAHSRVRALRSGDAAVEKLASRLVREALCSKVALEVAVSATVMAAWAMVGGPIRRRKSA